MSAATSDFAIFAALYLLVCVVIVYWPDLKAAGRQLVRFARGEL